MSVLDRLSKEERLKLTELFRAKAEALPVHMKMVGEEADSPTHSITRHGYQTGWESQLVRLVTGRTPDQPDDPEGSKDAVEKYIEKNKLPLSKRGKISFAKADSVGAFLSPEVESAAISRARAKASVLFPYTWAETDARGTKSWVPFDYVDMVVQGPHYLTGVSFKRAKNAPKLAEKDAVKAIEHFIKSKRVGPSTSDDTWEDKKRILDIMEDSGVAAPYTRSSYRQDYPLRFPTMQDLLSFLSVSALWMKHVNVVFRRFGPTDWRVHTAYCVHCTEIPNPLRGGPSVKTGKWTGNVRATENGPNVYINPASLI